MSERDVFEAALDLPPENRFAYLDGVCAGDVALRQRLEALLGKHDQAASFLEAPACALAATTAGSPPAERPGTVIGPYKLLEQIGEGGFGVVFMAEQTRPVRRKVALKVLKPGMDTRQVVARFEAERQALALMDHPNIARVLDGGQIGSGRPYFVMDLVKGLPITDYCDQARLTPRERLELFVSVCQAVQHAHQKGILHRDIKPSNVLVTVQDGKPLVKVIDFGIAKALGQQLTDKTLFTGFAQLIGTPLYMSPEQAALSNVDVDTRSDIYSLGVLVYELLTGTTPFDKERLREVDYDEMRRIIREEEPPKPSTRISTLGQAATSVSTQRNSDPRRLSQLCRGELDWIVMKALEKDRNRRYETASAFAADIERYLHDEPVTACPPSRWYAVRKFARRNRVALTTAIVITATLLAAAASIGWAIRDREARERALDRDEDRAVAEADTLIRAGKWPEAAGVLERAEQFLAAAGRTRRIEGFAELQRDLDMVRRIEDLFSQSLTNPAGQRLEVEYERAFREFGMDVTAVPVQQAAEWIGTRSIRQELIDALDIWSVLCRRHRKRYPELADRLLDVAAAADSNPRRERLRKVMRGDDQALDALAAAADGSELSLSDLHVLGQTWDLLGLGGELLRLLRQGQQHHPADPWVNYHLAILLHRTGQHADALRFSLAARALRPDNSYIVSYYGASLQANKAHREAVAEFARAIALKSDNVVAWRERAQSYLALGEPEKAVADYAKSFELNPREGIVLHYYRAANASKEERESALLPALAHYSRAVQRDPQDARARHLRALTYECLGQWDKAIEDHVRVIALDSASAVVWRTWYCRALAHEKLQQWDHAIAAWTQVIELERPASIRPWVPWVQRGRAHAAVGHWPEAIADYSRAIEKDAQNSEAGFTLADRMLAYAMAGQWGNAAADAQIRVEGKSDDEHRWMEWAAARLQAGDVAGYRATCKDMLARFGTTQVHRIAHRVALSCLLLPDVTGDHQAPLRLAALAAAKAPKDAWCQITHGIALYRNGEFNPAADLLRLTLKNWTEQFDAGRGPDAAPVLSWLVLAMASQQLGQTAEARQWLTRAAASMDRETATKRPGPLRAQAHTWAMCLILRREAETLLNKSH